MNSKKIIAISVLLSSCVFANAQISLTAASFPTVGSQFISHNDSLGASLTPGPSGANQVWDYTNLNNHYNDTTSAVTVASTPNGSSFPTADFAANNGSGYAYFKNTATESQIIGISGSQMGSSILNILYTSPTIVAKSGITYNSNYNFVSSFLMLASGTDVGQPVDSVRVHSNTYTTKVVDGWGTVTSPIGAFPCLRIMQRDSAVQVVDVKLPFVGWSLAFLELNNVNVSYSYVDDANINSIVQLNMDSTSSTVGSASYRESWPLGVKETVKPSLFTLYPNPSSTDNIHLLIGGLPAAKYLVQIFDMNGNEINSTLYAVNKTSVTDVNFSNLQLCSGNYIATVSTINNELLQSLKFEVVK